MYTRGYITKMKQVNSLTVNQGKLSLLPQPVLKSTAFHQLIESAAARQNVHHDVYISYIGRSSRTCENQRPEVPDALLSKSKCEPLAEYVWEAIVNLIPSDHRVLHKNREVSLTMIHKCCKYIANGVPAKVRALLRDGNLLRSQKREPYT